MLSVAYISGQPTKKVTKPSKKELLHNEAVATLAVRRAHDKKKAFQLFEAERAEIEELERKLKSL